MLESHNHLPRMALIPHLKFILHKVPTFEPFLMEGVDWHIFFELHRGFSTVPTVHKSVILVILSIRSVIMLCKTCFYFLTPSGSKDVWLKLFAMN